MQEIILIDGLKIKVSDEDYEPLNIFDWRLYGRKGKGFYVIRKIKGKTIYLHHEVFKRQGIIVPKGMETDHKDHDTLNNQRDNLRVVTTSVNQHNSKTPCHNTSGYKGVSFNNKTQKWVASIQVSGKQLGLGSYIKIEDAIAARLAANIKYKNRLGILDH